MHPARRRSATTSQRRRPRLIGDARPTRRAGHRGTRRPAEYDGPHEVRLDATAPRRAVRAGAGCVRPRRRGGRRGRRVRPLVPVVLDLAGPPRHLPRGPLRPTRAPRRRARTGPAGHPGRDRRRARLRPASSGRCWTGTRRRSGSTGRSAPRLSTSGLRTGSRATPSATSPVRPVDTIRLRDQALRPARPAATTRPRRLRGLERGPDPQRGVAAALGAGPGARHAGPDSRSRVVLRAVQCPRPRTPARAPATGSASSSTTPSPARST